MNTESQNLQVPLLVVTGFSGSGKTTFNEKFIKRLKQLDYHPGYIKHAGKSYSLDVPGKDSARQMEAGASFSAVFTEGNWSVQHQGSIDMTLLHSNPHTDIIILEGFKKSDFPKVVCFHPTKGYPEGLSPEQQHTIEASTVWAYLTIEPDHADQINQHYGEIIAFQRDAIDEIVDHLLIRLKQHCEAQYPLRGAVMIGGKSTRMGKDKAWLDYGSGPHAYHLFQLLSQHSSVQEVTYAGFPLTTPPIEIPEDKLLTDRFLHLGPMGGLLTLFDAHPQSAWFLVACDLAGLQQEAINYLISHRNPLKAATVFANEHQRFEPLVAIYEPRMGLHLKRALLNGEKSFQRIFPQLAINQLTIPMELREQLTNVNTPEERTHVIQKNI